MKHLIFSLVAGLSLAVAPTASYAKIEVITSITPLKSITESIGGDLVDVKSIGRGTEDPHFVEVRPSFIMTIAKAKMYVSIGMQLDYWAKPLIENSRNPDILTVYANPGIHVLGLPSVRVTAQLGDVHPEGNPHYWLDPYNVPTMVKNILAGLVQVDPPHAQDYQKNAKAFLAQLKKADQDWQKRLKPYAGTKIVTFHESWDYFAKHFHFVVEGQVEPKPGIPPSGAHTEEIIQLVKRDHIPLIIQEPYYPSAHPDLIAKKTGAKVLKLPQLCEGGPGTETYLKLLEYNVSHLEKALKDQGKASK